MRFCFEIVEKRVMDWNSCNFQWEIMLQFTWIINYEIIRCVRHSNVIQSTTVSVPRHLSCIFAPYKLICIKYSIERSKIALPSVIRLVCIVALLNLVFGALQIWFNQRFSHRRSDLNLFRAHKRASVQAHLCTLL